MDGRGQDEEGASDICAPTCEGRKCRLTHLELVLEKNIHCLLISCRTMHELGRGTTALVRAFPFGRAQRCTYHQRAKVNHPSGLSV